MTKHTTLDGILWADMVAAGAANLHAHMEEVNDLNVFPIPDGDTGENMMLTMQGGTRAAKNVTADLGATSAMISDGMLLGARGNSGVILSSRELRKAFVHTSKRIFIFWKKRSHAVSAVPLNR